MSLNAREYNGGVLFDIAVKPGSGGSRIKYSRKKGLVVSVQSPPVAGKANREVVALLSSALGHQIEIHGSKQRPEKSVFVPGMTVEQLEAVFEKGNW